MDAIVVTPNIPKATPDTAPQTSTQTDTDSTFAPALSKAISSKSNTPNSSKEKDLPADVSNKIKTDADEEITSADHQDISALATLNSLQHQQEKTSNIKSDSYITTKSANLQQEISPSAITDKQSNNINIEPNLQQQAVNINRPAIAVKSEGVLNPVKEQAQIIQEISPGERGSVISEIAKKMGGENRPEASQKATFGIAISTDAKSKRIAVSTLPAQQLPPSNLTNSENRTPEMTFNHAADSIRWSQVKTDNQHVIQHSSPLSTVSLQSETTKVPSLTTESVIASLTDLSLDQKQPNVLRTQNTSLRHDIASQFIDAKIQQTERNDQQGTNEHNLDSKNDSVSQSQSLSLTLKSGEGSPDSAFSQSLNQLLTDKAPQHVSDIFRPGAAMFTHQAIEDNIVNQVVQKFRASQLLQNSKLTLKLHPAELGELKLDIRIKEGSVNASIIAQSQQVQDVLEKNMPRLKALMEQNGLKVNEIVVRVESDVPEEFNLFEDHLSQEGNQPGTNQSQSNNVIFELDDDALTHPESIETASNLQTNTTGVNVRA